MIDYRQDPMDAVPPQSLEMEQAVLGCCIVDNTCIARAAESLTARVAGTRRM